MAPNSHASSDTMTEPPTPRQAGPASARASAPHPANPSHFRLVASPSLITPDVLNHKYAGTGTAADPHIVEFLPHDPRNPMLFSRAKRWALTFLMGVATLAVTFNSSAYSGGVIQVLAEFHCSEEVVTLGISLFVLGFAIGPLLWGPLSELYGRQVLFFGTYAALVVFLAGAGGAQNIETLLILRFWAGAFGSSPLVNAGGIIADMFPAKERGLALTVFAIAPFMGPVLGPIVGGFVAQSIGWRWLEWVMALFAAVVWLVATFLMPETYAPVILRARAAKLSQVTGREYISVLEKRGAAKPTVAQALKTALSRPWIFLVREPIVTIITIYMAIVYGTLYLCFSAFPIVFQRGRGWSEGIGGLAFIGVAVGFMLALAYIIPDNGRYARADAAAKAKGLHNAPPEARLPPALIGSVLLPVGLFWFAWTNGPEIHWIVPIIASAPFGAGMIFVFLSCFNYLIDSYTVYAASVLAANSILRSLFGAAFPLFTTQMFDNLGIHWAASVPAFLALACVPFPFLFYKYGEGIRRRCKYSKQAMEIMEKIKASEHVDDDGKEVEEKESKGKDDTTSSESKDIERGNTKSEEQGLEKQRSYQSEVVGKEAGPSSDGLQRKRSQPAMDVVKVDSHAERPECDAPDVDGQDIERAKSHQSVPY